MCCAFNMKAADEIFSGETYPNLVKKLQDYDTNNRFEDVGQFRGTIARTIFLANEAVSDVNTPLDGCTYP